jgi:hypothetical protein
MRWLVVVACAACSSHPSAGGGGGDAHGADGHSAIDGHMPVPGSVFDPVFTDVTVEIDYESGEEPYTGPIIGFGDTFDTVTTNIDRLFASKKHLVIPRVLADMENIGTIPNEALTVSDILAIAAAHRNLHDTATLKTYYVVFVSGSYADANGPIPGVLGVSIGDTGVVCMFKDEIRSSGIVGVMNVERYVEQSTMVHELGHQIGLVNNGLEMVAAHEDTAHPAHCTNDQCALYWQNDGTANAARFAQQHVLTGSSIIYGPECLDDADAVNGSH